MTRYLVRRLRLALIVLISVLTMVFFLIRVSGDPALYFVDEFATPEEIERVRESLGLGGPLHVQYLRFLRQTVAGDFGTSFRYGCPALKLVFERLPSSLELTLVALTLGVVIGLPLGIFAAVKRGSVYEVLATVGAIIGVTMPNFWLGILLIIVFAVHLRLLPTSGRGSVQHLILPALTLSVTLIAQLARLGRSSMLEVMAEDYMRTARAKGVSERWVIIRHALPNALIPVVTMVALSLPRLIGSMVVVETLFAWPGMGMLLIQSVYNRDYPVVLASVFSMSLVTTLVFLATDLVYVVLDPRIRYESR